MHWCRSGRNSLALLALAAALPVAAQAPRYLVDSFPAADGVQIRYLVQGSGPPVVLVHGFALSAELNWAAPGAMDSLAPSFTVIALDLRGHGRSGKPHDAAAYGPLFVDDVLGLLDHLTITRAHIAGYSLGAIVALRFAAAHPDRVISVVLGGGGWQRPGQAPPPFRDAWLAGLARAARGEIAVSEALRRPDAPAVPASVQAALDRNDPLALGAALRSLPTLALPEELVRNVAVPVLAVVGERDPARAVVNALRNVVPQITVVVIPEADHAAAMSHPQLAGTMLAFLRSH